MQAVRSVGLDRLKRFVCLLLIFVLLFMFFLVPHAQAFVFAPALAYYGAEIVATVLVAGGVAFVGSGAAQEVGASIYRSLSSAGSWAATKINAIGSWALANAEKVGNSVINVSKDLFDAIVSEFKQGYSDGKYSASAGTSAKFYLASDATADEIAAVQAAFDGKQVSDFYVSTDYRTGVTNYYHYFITVYDTYAEFGRTYVWSDGSSYAVIGRSSFGSRTFQDAYISVNFSSAGRLSLRGRAVYRNEESSMSSSTSNSVTTGLWLSTSPFDIPVSAPDIAYPSDNSLVKAPDLPTVASNGSVTYPSSMVYTKDAVAAPYPVDSDGNKIGAIPTDVPVDGTTGKDLTDTDTGTDTDTPGTDTGTDTDTPSDTVSWPSSADLSLPKLIISKFPFCIPFDVANMIGLLEAEPKAPVFKMPLKVGAMIDEEITLDLEQFSDVIRIIRWGELILFVAGLAYVTRNYIKW